MILGFSVIKYTYSAYFFIVHYITSTHECHFIVFISMLIKFHLDFFYSLCCASLFLSYLCKFLLLSFIFIPILYFIIILISITNVNSIMQRMIEALLMNTNTRCVHLMLHYDATWRFIRFIY